MGIEKTLGDAIVERLSGVKLDARAKGAAREFTAKHKRYAVAYDAASAKEEARAAALEAVGAADEVLDAGIDTLADRLIGSGLVKRARPFDGLSDRSPSELCSLGYAAEIAAAGKLTKAVRKKKPAKDVLAACNGIDAATAKTAGALKVYDAKHKEWIKAAAERDACLLDWQKSLTRLRILAKASLIDDPGAYAALFAPPEGITVAKRKRRKKPAASGPAVTAAAAE